MTKLMQEMLNEVIKCIALIVYLQRVDVAVARLLCSKSRHSDSDIINEDLVVMVQMVLFGCGGSRYPDI